MPMWLLLFPLCLVLPQGLLFDFSFSPGAKHPLKDKERFQEQTNCQK
jgi:hypothetical protein